VFANATRTFAGNPSVVTSFVTFSRLAVRFPVRFRTRPPTKSSNSAAALENRPFPPEVTFIQYTEWTSLDSLPPSMAPIELGPCGVDVLSLAAS
jgi:hypothetical protein